MRFSPVLFSFGTPICSINGPTFLSVLWPVFSSFIFYFLLPFSYSFITWEVLKHLDAFSFNARQNIVCCSIGERSPDF